MYESMGEIALESGETVQMGRVIAPDLAWAEPIERLLAHKGDPWNWQNTQVLRSDVGVEAIFYVLHRDGQPLANIMTAESKGVGILGHVWTNPDDRRKGAMKRLMAAQMEHFRARGGRALFLGTGFESVAFRLYQRFGFRSVEDKGGYMDYYTTSKAEFESDYFAAARTEIRDLSWSDWPASAPLFVGGLPGLVRCAPLGLFGRASTEGPLLLLLRDEVARRASGEAPRSKALVAAQSGSFLGLAAWGWHPLWPGICIVDVYCHPDHWRRGPELLGALQLPAADRYIAYCDPTCTAKIGVIAGAGLQQMGIMAKTLAANVAKTEFVDIIVFEKA